MYVRSLPRSRRSRNRRRSGRWIRSGILDKQFVAPSATIGVYLLDENRCEVERACDRSGAPIALPARASEADLQDVLRRYGDGRYRLVARNRKGHILARLDIAAAIFRHDLDALSFKPRTDVERLTRELAEARAAVEAAHGERDAAQIEVGLLKAALAERMAEIDGLEAALDKQGQALRRARRLYAQFGGSSADAHGEAQSDDPPEQEEPQEPADSAPSADARKGETVFGVDRGTFEDVVGLIKELVSDKPARDEGEGDA